MTIPKLIKLWREFEKETREQHAMILTKSKILKRGEPAQFFTHAWFDEFIDWLEAREKK